tara:strand:+ start:13256 stop:16015 length:2760 start_codon:yes stop_codon:yes gene_type:complete
MADDPYAAVATPVGDSPPPAVDEYKGVGTQIDAKKLVDFEDAAVTTAQSAASGAVKSGSIVGGMIMGGKLGALGGPAAPITVPLGIAAGGTAGYFFGEGANEQLSKVGVTSAPPETLSPELRPFGYGGEALGGGFTMIGATMGIAKSGIRMSKSFVGNLVNRVLDGAKNAPKTFAVVEGAAVTTAAMAATSAEMSLPGNTPARIAAEVAGGLFNPVNTVRNGFSAATHGVKTVLKAVSPAARQSQAANILQEVLEAGGEDPVLIKRLLDDAGMTDAPMTAAQKTGSKALAVFEARLSSLNGGFSGEAKELGDAALSSLETVARTLRNTGDPKALAEAAKVEAKRFKLLLDGRVNTARRLANEAAQKITKDTPAAREEISTVSRKLLGDAMSESRKVEGELWDGVDKSIEISGDFTALAISTLKNDLLPEEKLPAIIEGFLKRVDKNTKTLSKGGEIDPKDIITTGDMMRLRSRALELARDAQVAGKSGDARIFGNVAEHVLDDLDEVADPAYDTARAFSKELNDTFTRTFAGHALAKGTRGDRLPPELMMERALASGGSRGALQMQEIEEATRFADTIVAKYSNEVGEFGEKMLQAQERMIRLAASNSIDPETGVASTKRLSKFISDNETLMKRFPDVDKDLKAAVKSQQDLDGLTRSITHAEKRIEAEAVFAKVGKFENSVDAVSAAVKGKNPIRDLTKLTKLAKKGGEEAVQGLRSSVLDNAVQEASKGQGFSFQAFDDALFKPVREGQEAVVDVMLREGGFTKSDVSNLKKIIAEADRITAAGKASGRADENFPGGPAMIEDFVSRIVGSGVATKLASKFGTGGAGHGLIVARGGSSIGQKVLDKIPSQKITGVLIQAVTDPKLMKILLAKPKTAKEAFKLQFRAHSYLMQAGLTSIDNAELPDLINETPVAETKE